MDEMNGYVRRRRWYDFLIVIGVGVAAYAFLMAWKLPCLHPAVWDEVAVAAGLRLPSGPFPGIYRILVRGLFAVFSPDTALKILPHLGHLCVSVAAMFLYLVFRDILPATLRINEHMARIGARVGNICALMAALLFVCADPVWRAGQAFSPVSVFLVLTILACYLFFRFLRLGSIPCLYACSAVIGCISAEYTLGFLIALIAVFGVLVAVNQALDPDVPLVNPLVNELVRAVVFKRLTYVWEASFILTLALNVLNFISMGGTEVMENTGVLCFLFEYFRAGCVATFSASKGSGWLFIFLLTVLPFIFAIKLLPRAWDDDKFLPWGVSLIYCVVGVAAISQLCGANVLWFWTWLGNRHTMVASDTLLSFALLFNVAVVTFSLAVFGVDAVCRNYRRIAKQQYPESVFDVNAVKMVESLGRARALRKRMYWSIVLLIPLLVVPWRYNSVERGIAKIISETVEETVREAEGCDSLFTDGSFDSILELEALRCGRKLNCMSFMEDNTRYARLVRQRAARDDEDRALLETDAASALRSWVATKPERLNKSGVQIGFEMWKRAKRPLPPCSGLMALPGGVSDEERVRALKACKEIGNEAYELAEKKKPHEVPDSALRGKFPFILWRLARMSHIRSRVAEEAGNQTELFRELANAEELDRVNVLVKNMRRDMNWVSKQNGGNLSPREGLVIGLARADFALAGRYAAPVLNADPDDPRANFALGMMHYQDEQYSLAEKHLARCLKRRPEEPAVLNNLAIVQMKLGKLNEAEASVRLALKKYPDMAELKKTLENVLNARADKKLKRQSPLGGEEQ